MKHPKYLLPVLGLLIVAATLWCIRHPRTLPENQCSPVYQHYAQVPGIQASFVKDFPLNDTLSIDVTFLQATTDSAWTLLRQDFGVKPLHNKIIERHGKNAVSMRLAPKKDYSLPMDTTCRTNNDLLLISRAEQIICIFHVSSSWQIKAIEDWQFNAMINRTPLKTIENEQ